MAVLNRERWSEATGAELVEFALVLPLLALVTLGIVDFAFLFQKHLAVTNAAREGARVAVLPGYSPDDARRRVERYLESAGATGSAHTDVAIVLLEPGGGGAPINAVRVSVEYPYRLLFLAPFLRLYGGSTDAISLKAIATMRSEVQLGG